MLYKILCLIVLPVLVIFAVIGCGGSGGNDNSGNGNPTAIEAEATIGPEGGVLEIIDPSSDLFGTTIEVPPTATEQNVTISIKKVETSSIIPRETISAGPAIDIGPDGFVFESDIILTIPYNDQDNDGFVDGTNIPESFITILTQDEDMERWFFLEIIDQDQLNNSISVKTNHFSQKKVVVIDPDKYGRNDVLFFSIDGCKPVKILPDSIITSDDDLRPAYLQPALINYFNLGLNKFDIYSYGGGVGESWHGDPNNTEDILPNLCLVLQSQKYLAEAMNKQFVLITHSWGTVLGFLAMEYTNVIPDLFITLSSPLGTQNIYPNVPWDSIVNSYLFEQIQDVRNKISDILRYHRNEYPDLVYRHDPYTNKWINYWTYGDVFSGPISPEIDLYDSLIWPPDEITDLHITYVTSIFEDSFKDVQIEDEGDRSIRSTLLYHSITSLGGNSNDADRFKNRVRNDLVVALGLDNDGDDDEIPDSSDNCIDKPNPDQADNDDDGIGDVCDNDHDNDGIFNAADLCDDTPIDEIPNSEGCSISQINVEYLNPENEEIITEDQYTFKWKPINHNNEGSFSYYISLKIDEEPEDRVFLESNVNNDKEVLIFGFETDKQYFWHVWAVDDLGHWSKALPAEEWHSFTTSSDHTECNDEDNDDYYAQSDCGTAIDCDDNNFDINPGATEICDDSNDNDCDGDTDCDDVDCDESAACKVDPNADYSNSIGMTFNLIPAGTFMMGSSAGELGHDSDEDLHGVTLTKSFYMQTTEVTQKQWESVKGINPSYFISCGNDCPVDNVSWDDIQLFLATLNGMGEGKYRLPTEAEWEYAARAGSATAYENGENTTTSCGYDPNLTLMGWYCYNAETTHLVAQKDANAWGLYDMHGNVWEWCQDRYDWGYQEDPVTDPTGPVVGNYRVLRGGSYYSIAAYSRSAERGYDTPSDPDRWKGFRLVREP